MIKRIHINQHNIKHNAKNPDDLRPSLALRVPSIVAYASIKSALGPTNDIYDEA